MGEVFVFALPFDILDLDFISRRLEPMLPEVVPRLPRPCIEPLVLVPLVVPIEPLVVPIEPFVVPIEPLVVPIEPLVVVPLVVPIEPLVVVPLVVPIEPLVVPIEPLVVPIEPLVLLPLVVPIEPLVVPVVVVPVVVWAKAALLRPSVKRAASKILVVFMVLRNENVEKMKRVLTKVVFTNCRPSLVTKLLINFA